MRYHSVATEPSAMKMNDLVLLLVSVPVLIHGETECPCKTISIPHEETSNEVHPYQRLIFEPISVRRVFDMTTFTVTYIADIRGPTDAISKFNGTVRRIYDAGENPILEARLAIPAMETQTNNPIAFILSSESTSSSFVMDINKTQTADKQTDFRGNRCHFTTSSTTVGNTFRYNARTSCPDKVSSYFKPILSKRGKGVLSFEEIDELKEKKYFNSTTSNDGTEASFSINPIGMLVDGIKMESLKFQILTISKNELDLVAFNVWSFDIV